MARTYEAMAKANKGPIKNLVDLSSLSKMNDLELLYKKQIQDLEKKVVFLKEKNEHTVFNFTASHKGEGVSTTLCNLVRHMAMKNSVRKILLIDANFQRPVLHAQFESNIEAGFTELLSNTIFFTEAICAVESLNLHVVHAGKAPGVWAGSFTHEKIQNVINEIKDQYHFIFIDSAPILESSDALASAIAADVNFLIVKSGSSQIAVSQKAKLLLEDHDCKIGGVVLNGNRQVIPNWLYNFF